MKRHRNGFHNFICLITITAMAFSFAAVPVMPIFATEENTSGDAGGDKDQLRVLSDEETIPALIGTTKSEEKTASASSGNTTEEAAEISGETETNEADQKSEAEPEAAHADAEKADGDSAEPKQAEAATEENKDQEAAAASESAEENLSEQSSHNNESSEAEEGKPLADTVQTPTKEDYENYSQEELPTIEATVTPSETETTLTPEQTEEGLTQTKTQSYEFDFVLTQEQVDGMLGRPQLNILGTGADSSFIISVEKQVALESIEKGKPSQLEFTVTTEFADISDKVELGVTTAEGYGRDYNFVLRNLNSFNRYVGGYAFIYDKDEYDADATGEKFRRDHFAGKTERVFDAAEIGTEKRAFPMVCELVLDDDLYAGHWSGVMQFSIKYNRDK